MNQYEAISQKIDNIDSEIDRLKSRKEELEKQQRNIESKYWQNGAPCPKCGSDEKPEVNGFAQLETIRCRNCDFRVRRWN